MLMFIKVATLCLIAGIIVVFSACESSNDPAARAEGSNDGDSDGDSDGDTDGDGDGDSDGDTDPSGSPGDIHGRVMSPAGNFPISGALVYVTSGNGTIIEDKVFCYDCEDMSSMRWTLSGSDGTWTIKDVPSGDWNIVTRKGFFQRQRTVTVVEGADTAVPEEHTTLPKDNSADNMDQIPNYAVLLNEWDRSHDLLAKFGMGEIDGEGKLQYGTETFEIFNDSVIQGTYAASSSLFSNAETIESYHQIFIPCTSSANSVSFINGASDVIVNYVSHGGKIYNSCCTAYWTEHNFPEYIDFFGDDNSSALDIGRITTSAYSTTGTINNLELGEWLKEVTTENINNFPFTSGYVQIIGTADVDNGHGLDDDDGVVKPYTWVTDASAHIGSPLMVTYPYDCGKVFFSVYETSNTPTAQITPQEYVLIYVILEVGVCDGGYDIE